MQKIAVPEGSVGGDTRMQTRPARTRAEIDYLPPFGKPEVVVVGDGAKAIGALGLLGALALASDN